MSDLLDELRQTLQEGQKRSGQGSYQRRAPNKDALPFLLKAKKGLRAFTAAHPEDADAWRLRSFAEETLLQYAAAIRSLEKAISLSPNKDRKDFKRLAAIKEIGAKWQSLLLAPEQLKALGDFLDASLRERQCDHTLALTQLWLTEHHPKSAAKALKAFQSFGGFCDCEVLANVIEG